ncbi:MAG TPA: choice-of-anchor tandem repeat GloVer-containing protein [Terriglobales bacterium]|nr:choice-of-anchor tandem repeat GloVer-containing protein [Terriglobales bacterium]
MTTKKTLTSLITVLAAMCSLLPAAVSAFAASTEKVLYSFKDNGTDGSSPYGSLVFGADGSLYGTTTVGGAYGNFGTVFELVPTKGGTWTEKVLHSFNKNGQDGYSPFAGLIFDAAGNLYGTTVVGGTSSNCNSGNLAGCGTVFQLTPGTNGNWTETVLLSFDKTDGEGPSALTLGTDGNLYGTTSAGGENDGGTVFQLVPGAGGAWTDTVLYNFCGGNCQNARDPVAGVIFDVAGNLYGTTSMGGHKPCCDAGTVFELTPGTGGWTETLLYSFELDDFKNGDEPYAGLMFDASGNLYGTTRQGGAYRKPCGGAGCGTVFQLVPGAGGKWKQRELHSFGKGTDGMLPDASLTFDAAGNLWGTTSSGGAYQKSCGCGTVFKLTHGTGGTWTEKVLHSFGKGADGSDPLASVIFDAAGNLYGTTSEGGAHNSGTVFEITP